MLDIDHGTYPFVTSSNCSAGGAVTGSGVGMTPHRPRARHRQGLHRPASASGPFPTELPEGDPDGETLCSVGGEFGVTTGRKRRCGWYDAVAIALRRRASTASPTSPSPSSTCSSGFDTIKVCTAYECDGVTYRTAPQNQTHFHHAKPVYEEVPGLEVRTSRGCRSFEELPQAAQDYIAFLEELAGVRVSIVAVGPSREQTIMRGW